MTRNQKFTLIAVIPALLLLPLNLLPALSPYRYYGILGMLIAETIIVLIFAQRMEKKEIVKRIVWAIVIGIFAIILKYINF
ncbi:hypothetical protein [Parafilimonas sp.]|jgi:hypothetical protein|uniref:hypothetical protein n=1 Tax=Parafilimonas sp. TaxID=1969739 RepID=UPI003F7D0A6C